jgi:dinuclear metal center YbgI/SA1388 family protein
MPSVADIYELLDSWAPFDSAFSFDRVGLQLGSKAQRVDAGVVSLDWSNSLVEFATDLDAQLLICHHPLIWEPLKAIIPGNRSAEIAVKLIRADLSFIAYHTNWDCAAGGINDALATKLGLEDISSFGAFQSIERAKLIAYVPKADTTRIIDAASTAGAGIIGNYDRCAFVSAGIGTFRPNDEANPTIGGANQIEEVEEDRIEMVVPVSRLDRVIRAVREAHAYEEPVLDLYRLHDQPGSPDGRLGMLGASMTLEDFKSLVDEKLGTQSEVWGRPNKKIQKVAVVGGAADNEWRAARQAGADVFVTGEVKQNVALDAAESGLAIVAAGHFATEQPGMAELCRRLKARCPEVTWTLYEPEPGLGGRPI